MTLIGKTAMKALAFAVLGCLAFVASPLLAQDVRAAAPVARRAGVPVLGAFEWGLGENTTRANAALVGRPDIMAGRTSLTLAEARDRLRKKDITALELTDAQWQDGFALKFYAAMRSAARSRSSSGAIPCCTWA